jgi:hypothetical protein
MNPTTRLESLSDEHSQRRRKTRKDMDIGDALLVQSPDALPDLVGIRYSMTLVNRVVP